MNGGVPPDGQMLTPTPAAPGSLGDVAGQANGGPNYLQDYMQALNTANQMVAPAMGHADPPSILKNILSFGHAGADYDATQSYNAALRLKAADMAANIVNSRARSDALSQQQLLNNLRTTIDLQKFQETLRENQLRDVDRQHRQLVGDTIDQSKITPDQKAYLNAQGLDTAPSEIPGRVRLVPRIGGGWAPATPGSPVDVTLNAVGGGPPKQSGPKPGESPEDYMQRRKTEAAGAQQSAKETATANTEMDRNMKDVESWFNSPEWTQARQLLPKDVAGASMNTVLGPAKAWLARKTATPGANFFRTANTLVLPALRALEMGAKNTRLAGQMLSTTSIMPQVQDLQSLRMTQDEAEDFKKTILDRFKAIRKQVGTGDLGGSAATESTGTTGGQLGTSRRLSSGKLILEEP